MAVELRFQFPVEPTPGPVELVFGRTLTPAVIEGTLAATLPAPALSLTLAARVVPVVLAAVEATLPAPALALTLTAVAVQDLDLPSDVGPVLSAHQTTAIATSAALEVRQQQMLTAQRSVAAAQQHGAPLAVAVGVRQHQMLTARRPLAQRHAHGLPLGAGVSVPHAEHLRARRPLTARHTQGLPLAVGARTPHAEQIRTHRPLVSRAQHGLPLAAGVSARHHHGLATATPLGARQQQAIPLPVGFWQGTLPGGGEPSAPYSSPVRLVFWRLADGSTRLVFGNRPAPGGQTVVIPIREVYVVINTFSLVRADTSEPVEVSDFSASLDADSWCWGWSASLRADLMPLVRTETPGDYVDLIATINGTALRLVVERLGRDRRFGSSMLKISGRGRAAWLADPHAPVETRYNASQRTAQQLLADALTINNVSIGWNIDWRITDWLVPAGAWSHTGTYMDAATRIAESGGAYIQAHNTAQTLIVLPRYPAAPWNWGSVTPDLELPEDVCEVENIEWQDRPAYNAVYVVGGAGGRRDRIRRAGLAADRLAQTIVDPLATAPEMTIQRGTAALGDTGRQAHITLRLPVLPETGIIQPGRLIRYVENGNSRLGLSRAVQIDQRFPELWQSIRLESHE